MSQLTDFYRGTGTDSQGRTIAEIWAYSHEQMEGIHDFIQWLFPLKVRSRSNPGAPLLTSAEIAEFHADPALREALGRSFELYLAFLGLRFENGRVVKGPDFDRNDVFQYPDHNWLRITRVLTCTRLLGLEDHARAFFEFLTRHKDSDHAAITKETFRYWERAANGPLS